MSRVTVFPICICSAPSSISLGYAVFFGLLHMVSNGILMEPSQLHGVMDSSRPNTLRHITKPSLAKSRFAVMDVIIKLVSFAVLTIIFEL